MDQEMWLDSMEQNVKMIQLVSYQLQDFIYSLPMNRISCCGEETDGCDEYLEEAELLLTRLDIVESLLPKLNASIATFRQLMTSAPVESNE